MSCLIVDDSTEFVVAATHLLSVQGLAVVGGAAGGAEARRLTSELRPDVVLVDVELGEEDGLEVARDLAAGGPPPVVIVISLRDREEVGELLIGSGTAGFLRKDALDADAVLALAGRGRDG